MPEQLKIRGGRLKASIILAHPYPKSFNHAIFQTVCTTLSRMGIKNYHHDLYEEGYDPLLKPSELSTDTSQDKLVNQYAKEMLDSDYLFFIHPNWWGQPPAILKGYIDRIFRPPHAYDFPPGDSGGGLPIGKLKNKYGVVINTSNTEKEREENFFGDPLENIWKQCVFKFCGIENYYRKMFRVIADSDTQQRKSWLQEVEDIVKKVVNKAGNL